MKSVDSKNALDLGSHDVDGGRGGVAADQNIGQNPAQLAQAQKAKAQLENSSQKAQRRHHLKLRFSSL